jgi:hypothetical protein
VGKVRQKEGSVRKRCPLRREKRKKLTRCKILKKKRGSALVYKDEDAVTTNVMQVLHSVCLPHIGCGEILIQRGVGMSQTN